MTDLTALTEALAAVKFEADTQHEWTRPMHETSSWVEWAESWVAEHVAPLLAEREAKAWDEGHAAVGQDQAENWGRWPGTPLVETRNPYRSAVSGEPRQTFEQSLASPAAQFTAPPELLASIIEYAAAPSASAGSRLETHYVGDSCPGGHADVDPARQLAEDTQPGATHDYP